MIALRLLGPVDAVAADGRSIPLGGPIARLLLVQLVLAAGRAVPDEQAVDAIWGERPPNTADAALRVHIAHLRRSVAGLGGRIQRRHHGYLLCDLTVTTDLAELERLEAEMDRAPPQGALVAAETALALWRAPSLTDLRRLPLGERLAAGLDRRRESVTDRRLALLLATGRPADVLAPLERLLYEDPLDEGRWALLAAAHYHCGRPAAALDTIARACALLDRELGLLPGPALRDLRQRILTHTVEPIAPAATSSDVAVGVPVSLEAHAAGRLFGRSDELDLLTKAIDAAVERGTSRLVHLAGEPGVGKSALAAAAAELADERGLRVLHGWCEQGAPRSLGLLTGPLRTLLAETPRPSLRPFEPCLPT